MTRSPNHAALYEAIEQFQTEVRRLALGAVHTVLGQEIDRKRAKQKPARRRAAPAVSARAEAAASAATAREPVAPPAPPEPAADAATSPPPDEATSPPPTTEGGPETTTAAPTDGRKRGPWTRDSITSELATWMLSGTAIDAAFVTRYGPPGLVAAARRLFGRFDAALNVAGLHISKLYPDGPPKPGTPGTIAVAGGGRRPAGWTPSAAPRRERSKR